jgi:hypothetical protein
LQKVSSGEDWTRSEVGRGSLHALVDVNELVGV